MSQSPANASAVSAPPNYLSDQPSQTDEFERREFAIRLADTIVKRGLHECLTVSIVGPWGSGKSTVLEMMGDVLSSRKTEEGTCLLVRFNPWKYSGQDTLLYHLFEAMVQAIDPELKVLDTWKDIKRKAAKASKLISTSAALASQIWAPGSGAVTGGLLNALLPEEFKAQIDELKASTSQHLRSSRLRMVVLLDDVDRLEAAEILLLFRSLKLVADLPNTTFVLAMDEDHVSQIIGRQLDGNAETGLKYLEKIINARLKLPVIPPEVLEEYALDTFTKVWRDMRNGQIAREDASRVRSIFGRLHAPYLRTPRRVKSIANAFHFALGMLPDELNPGDVLLLEATRLLHPSLYDKLQEVIPGVPTTEDHLLYMRKQKKETLAQKAKKILSECLPKDHEKAVEALSAWFPQIESAGAFEGVDEANKRLRLVCSPEYFWRYFSMGIHKKDVRDATVKTWCGQAMADPGEAEAELAGHLKRPYAQVWVRKVKRLCDRSIAARTAVIHAFVAVVVKHPEFKDERGLSGSFFEQSAELAADWLGELTKDQRSAEAVNLVKSIASIEWNMTLGMALKMDDSIYDFNDQGKSAGLLDEELAAQSLAAYQKGDLPTTKSMIKERVWCLYRNLRLAAIKQPLSALTQQEPRVALQMLVGGCGFSQASGETGFSWKDREGLAKVTQLISREKLKEHLTAVLPNERPIDLKKRRDEFAMNTLEEVGWLCLDTIAKEEKAEAEAKAAANAAALPLAGEAASADPAALG